MDLYEIFEVLRSSIATNWIELGLVLGLYYPTLVQIDKQSPYYYEGCLFECLAMWLQRADNVDGVDRPSWRALVNALCIIDEHTTADRILSSLSS